MNRSHIKVEYIENNLIVTALSKDAKEVFKNKDQRDFLIDNMNLMVDYNKIASDYHKKTY